MRRLIEVTTPGNGKTYEFTLDSGVKAGQARRAVVREIVALENGGICLDEETTAMFSKKRRTRLPDGGNLFDGSDGDCEFYLV
ncbi:MAG: hypothetical protein LBK41_07950 [Clostridiales bacterium]|jgi:hypothetical protein|nr:hypothetical protein [Clostridiales bacterium]